VKSADHLKYFGDLQIKGIRRTARDAAELALANGKCTAVRSWILLDLLTGSGFRAAEAADLRIGDIMSGYGQSALAVRNGKGSKERTVVIGDALRLHLKSFVQWKREKGEAVGPDDHLFIGQRGPITPQGVSLAVKKVLKRLGLYERGKAAHSMRHSYAVAVYKRERDLRAVQKQLGHASIATTTIYADVSNEDLARQVKGLWG
jgi:site-specific recombinase XerD